MPLKQELEKIRKEEKEWKKEHNEELDKWKEKVEASDVKENIKDIFSHEKDADWTKEQKEQLDALLEQAVALEKEMSMFVKISNELTPKEKDGTEIIDNEFYTRGNEGQESGDVNALEANQDLVILKVPEGEKVAPLNENEQSLLLLRRDTTYRITNTIQVNDDSGNQHTKYEAELISKNDSSKIISDIPLEEKKKKFEQYYKESKLSDTDIAALNTYTGSKYREINKRLRTIKGQKLKKSELDKVISEMDTAMEKAIPLEEDTIVYRSTRANEFKKAMDFLENTFRLDLTKIEKEMLNDKSKKPEGNTSKKEIADRYVKFIKQAIKLVNARLGETSTAWAFTSTSIKKTPPYFNSSEGFPIRIEIILPKGTKAIYLEPLTKVPGELELLLPRGSKFEIEGASALLDKEVDANGNIKFKVENGKVVRDADGKPVEVDATVPVLVLRAKLVPSNKPS